MEASSTIVIKVKYDNVLRRFDAPIIDGKLFLSMDGLREKIVTLISVAPDADLFITYVDEDGDVVALVDDDDLRDIVKQALNPLRVTVKVKDKNDNQNNSNASATPLQSPHVQHLPNLTAGVSEILRKVPEPLFEPLWKISGDLADEASLSSSSISELDSLCKPSSSLLSLQLSDSGVRLKKQNGASSSSSAADNKASEPLKVKPSSRLLRFKPATNMKRKEIKIQNVTGHKEEDPSFDCSVVAEGLESQNVNVCKPASVGVSHTVCRKEKGKKPVECSNGKSNVAVSHRTSTLENISVAPLHCASDGSILHHGFNCDGCGTDPIVGPRFKSKVKWNYYLCHSCFPEMGSEDDYILIDSTAVSQYHLPRFRARKQGAIFPRLYGFSEGQPSVVRLNSCFIQDVNIFDGTVMAPLTPFTKIWRMRNNGTVAWPQKSQLVWIGGDKLTETHSVGIQIPSAGLLMDQELDVSVDFISPELPGRYISHWRMATCSGQKFGRRVWILIQVDPSNNETPQDSVRNLNLNLPFESSSVSDSEFITVDPAPVESRYSNAGNSKKVEGSRLPSTEKELKLPINDSLLVGNCSGSTSVAPSSSSSAPRPIPVHVPDLVPTLPLVSAVPFPMPPLPFSSPYSTAPYNVIPPQPPFVPFFPPNAIPNPPFRPFFWASPPVRSPTAQPSPPTEPVAVAPEPAAELPGTDLSEDELRRKLEVGFKQFQLNKEIFRMNEYDLEQALDDLCSDAEWDPILEELNEMGFHETELNRVLLKNSNEVDLNIPAEEF